MEEEKKDFMKICSFFCLSLVMLAGLLTIAASGGGSISIKYTGPETQVKVTIANAEDIAVGAYSGGLHSMTLISGWGAVQANESGVYDKMTLYTLSKILEQAIEKADIGSQMGSVSTGAVQSIKKTIDGECGGSAAMKLNADDVSGVFDGTFSFDNYCESDIVMTGKIKIEGVINLDTEDMESFEITFTKLTEETDDISITFSGAIEMSVTSSSTTRVFMDLLLKDNTSDDVYWVNDYIMTVTETDSYVDLSLTGRYYDPLYGYADVAIDVPFRVYNDDFNPSEGVLVATGSGDSRARLTVLSSMTYQIEADEDGDGTYEYNSGALYW